jgi:hypothetical protein
VVCVALLLGLQVYRGSFETGWCGEMASCFSQGRHFLGPGSARQDIGRFSMGLGSRMSQFDICLMWYLLLIEREKKKKTGEMAGGLFSRADLPCWVF